MAEPHPLQRILMAPFWYVVITKVPNNMAGEAGNLAASTDMFIESEQAAESNGWLGRVEPLLSRIGIAALDIRTPVFELGEIVICDHSGREICGAQRKPSKWTIEYETFDSIEDAAVRAMQVTRDGQHEYVSTGSIDPEKA